MTLSDVISKDIKIKHIGGERYNAMCPWHKDSNPSLQIHDGKNLFKCFVCGKGGKGAAAYISLSRGITYKESLQLLKENYPKLDLEIKEEKEIEILYCSAHNSPKPDFIHYLHGLPTNIYEYRDLENQLVGYTCRYNVEGGGKVVLPYNYLMIGSSPEWIHKGFKAPSLPYNAQMIRKYPKATICIVEGEKAANQGNDSSNPQVMIFLAWVGGANAINYVDWSCLQGRDVILIPDHDKLSKDYKGDIKTIRERPGNKAMLDIASLILRVANSIEFVVIPEEYPNKWDIADRTWRKGDLKYWITKHKQKFFKLKL